MDDKEIKPEQTLPESPASVNTRMKTPEGFIVQWTIRDEKNTKLLFKFLEMQKKWIAMGWTPVEVNQFSSKPPQKSTRECLLHKVPMKEKISKTTGKIYYSHWEGAYPNLGGQCFGQGFTYQNNQVRPASIDDIPARDINDF